jgi:diguanylate cyclase (GGDEF)-like protein/PAS domain S-box-containing protein
MVSMPEAIDRSSRPSQSESASRSPLSDQLHAFFDNTQDLVLLYNTQGRIVAINPAVDRLLGYKPAEIIGRHLLDFVHPDDRARAAEVVRRRLSGETVPVEHEYRVLTKGGDLLHMLISSTPVMRDGAIESIHLIGRDITAHKVAKDALQRREEFYRAILENGHELICIIAADGAYTYISPSHERILGFTTEEVMQRQQREMLDVIHPDDRAAVVEHFTTLIAQPGGTLQLTFRALHRDGSWRFLEASANNQLHNPVINGIVINARDIGERKRLEERLEHQAFHDALTGLPNRARFLSRLEQALSRDDRASELLAVLYLDLDNFKTINDSLGHETGDQLLVALGERLRGCLRAGDTIARLGGDEFIMLLERLANPGSARAVADRIAAALQFPFLIDGHELFVTASIGIAAGPAGQEPAQEMLRAADIALYRAKHLGRARAVVFESSMTAQAREWLLLEEDLRRALARDELQLDYQPIIDLTTGAIQAVEALLRWQHPARGRLQPETFWAIAEATGLVVPAGHWALTAACAQVQRWQETLPGVQLHVNLSDRQLRSRSLVDEITAALRDTGLAPACLTLEITEAILLDEPETVGTMLERLTALGVRLALDRFGHGHSALGTLARFPFSTVKLDRGLVQAIGQDPTAEALAQVAIAAAHAFGLVLIAIGIETEAQRAWLEQRGCQLGQGYYFASPRPASELADTLAAQPFPAAR